MTLNSAVLTEIPGGQELIDWFGFVPTFHDGNLLGIELTMAGEGSLRIHGFSSTGETDDKGYFIRHKDVVVSFIFTSITHINLSDFDQLGIIFSFNVTKTDDAFEFRWDSSYGAYGVIRARLAKIELAPGKP